MAKLKLTISALEDVEETLRPLYVEKSGKFELDVDGVPEIRAALKTANGEAASLRTKFKDIDPDEVSTMREELTTLRAKAPDVETVRTTMLAGFEKEKAKLTAQNSKLQKHLEDALIDGTAIAAIAENKGSPKLLLPHIKGLVKLAEVDGQYVPQVLDAKGNPRVRDDGAAFTVKDLVSELKTSDEYGRAFDAPGTSGSGSSGSGSGGGAAKKRSEMNPEQKTAFIRQHGQDAYLALPFK